MNLFSLSLCEFNFELVLVKCELAQHWFLVYGTYYLPTTCFPFSSTFIKFAMEIRVQKLKMHQEHSLSKLLRKLF